MKTAEELQAELAQAQSEIASRDQQLRGVASERDQYRSNWQRAREEAGEVLRVDAQGNFAGFDTTEPVAPPITYAGGTHPLASYVDNPSQVDAYYQSLHTQQLNAAGYVTAEQAKQMAAEAYQSARGDGQVWRMHDKLVAQPEYAALADSKSALSQRTTAILQERRLGRPLAEAKGFDDWQYGDLGHLQFAADLATLQLAKEAAASGTVVADAKASAAHAGLSVGASSAAPVPVTGEIPKTSTGIVDWDKVRSDTESRAGSFGVKV